ncbi:transposase [Providencia hangzhouensis]|uniref:IS1/IS1595 family N-terminal zinc-binding domain-containing protein n=1 Tax=Providencia TaxID=586 RepID=UPI000D8B4F97|nr:MULTISPECIES: hypothetical protein [Providencia]PYZ60992.1 hypothetical protein DNK63_18540 [Providencia rettgeri]QIF64436.1 IS1 family transposase [Providencia sp. 1709051003]WOB95650.1 hypothetical protein P3L54_02240 [Providencia sp. PROV099]
MLPKIDVNVCKSEDCKNFALVDCADYVKPSFKLGYRAIYCPKCGGNSYLINNDDLKKIFYPYWSFYMKNIEKTCPSCYSTENIKYGTTAIGTVRYQCKNCNNVYSLKNLNKFDDVDNKLIESLLKNTKVSTIFKELKITPASFYRRLENINEILDILCRKVEKYKIKNKLSSIETSLFNLNCRVENKTGLSNNLHCIVSCCSKTGYVLSITTNWNDQELSLESIYKSQNIPAESINLLEENTIEKIYKKYESFHKRHSFDHIHYTSDNVSKHVIEPVVAGHSHFKTLEILLAPNVKHHFIHHEFYIRGAVLTAYGNAIRNEKCDVFYVISNENRDGIQYKHTGSYKVGWWKNIWHEYKDINGEGYKYICNLTSSKNNQPYEYLKLNPSLKYSEEFIKTFLYFFPSKRINSLSPKILVKILSLFSKYYNYCCIPPNETLTAAQRIGVAKQQYDLSMILNVDLYSDSEE